MGRKKAPTYRIVVAESAMPRDGRIIENIGHYNPRTEPMTLSVDRGRALYWLENGATPTDTVKSLLKRAGVFRPEEESAVADAAAAVVETAKKVGGAAKAAASAAAREAREAASSVAEAVSDAVDAVTGGEGEATDASETPAAGESAPAEEEQKA